MSFSLSTTRVRPVPKRTLWIEIPAKSPIIRPHRKRYLFSNARAKLDELECYFRKPDKLRLLCWFCLFSCALLWLYRSTAFLASPNTRININSAREDTTTSTGGDTITGPFTVYTQRALQVEPQDLFQLYNDAPIVPNSSLSIILPVTPDTITQLPSMLEPMINQARPTIKNIIVLTPRPLLFQAKRIVHLLTSGLEVTATHQQHPDILLHSFHEDDQRPPAHVRPLTSFLQLVASPWVMVLSLRGLDCEPNIQELLFKPKALPVPMGPSTTRSKDVGDPFHQTSDEPNLSISFAPFLEPPFVTPSGLLFSLSEATVQAMFQSKITRDDIPFAKLGAIAARTRHGSRIYGIGGFLLSGSSSQDLTVGYMGPYDAGLIPPVANPQKFSAKINFLLDFETFEDLKSFAPAACLLQTRYNTVSAMIQKEDQRGNTLPCTLPLHIYSTSPSKRTQVDDPISHYLELKGKLPDVMITTRSQIMVHERASEVALVKIPVKDLPFCDWVSSLSLKEWKAWHIPAIDISIITHDRPDSLNRLLTSLSQGRFFGDRVNLRFQMEQTADVDTKKLLEDFTWEHGALTVTRRVVTGGLLPAVVESWYPHSNHTYGLILEDDIEVSPLFYAWAKMTVLRYRYRPTDGPMSRLFGISLYQQKHNELHPSGRIPFDVTSLLANDSIHARHTTIPYLSPIPCSWGAVYFPEQWREFHDYLAVRLSEVRIKIGDAVVPNIRSNIWTNSWKKYFIELSYLRGYVMLYPNFPDFASFSTNHLELGSHVSEQSRSTKNKELFMVPLMPLPDTASTSGTGLFNLPGGGLPDLDTLPVFNLTGARTNFSELVDTAQQRRSLLGCATSTEDYDVRSLLCV